MQTSAQLPAPPAAPAPTTITVPGADGKPVAITVPSTNAEVRQLVLRRREISNQLSDVTARRSELASEINTAPQGVTRTGLEDRLKQLDQQILQLDADLAATGRQISSAPSDLVESALFENRPQSSDDFDEGVLAGGFGVLIPVIIISLYMRRRRRKRGTAEPARNLAADSTERLERLERGMESIAIEIERVSEGQRFVTKLLSESAQPAAARRIEQGASNINP